jgi:undecaprenyl-diphosphatase
MINAIILGLVEGITEFLPISSTGHLLIAEHLLGCRKSDAFNVLIQIGPIFASVLVFWPHITNLLSGIGDPKRRDELLKLATAFFLTGIGGLVIKHFHVDLPDNLLPISIATLVGAVVIWLVERKGKGVHSPSENLTWTITVSIAAAQLVAAIFPGTSRSGAIIMAALALGLSRPAAVRYAFLVGIPTMMAAGGKQLMDAIKEGQAAELMATDTLVAFLVATISAFLAVKWLLKFVQTRNFMPFAWYRLIMGLGLLIAIALGWKA